ncbi:ATP-binding protein [Streptomyces sp. NBC_01808]|uniref:ATP-binding protein n=1 Tax=Streptomyces sp. NBC_01808 TaxID=2975947 RepID=UPI002DD7F790|nr:ATP-binding protein [Streptomyces sp. NBC_01808]WSA39253.1 ATP-binding protein [Streptomyces sp. NBC_01808]
MTTDQNRMASVSVMKWRWRRHPRCVGLARAQLRKALAGWGLVGIEEPASLVLSELMTNAVVHARVPPGREIQTRFVRQEDGVIIEVHDASDVWPKQRVPDDCGGYGLLMVEKLAARWGVAERNGIGKMVWAVVLDTTAPSE